MLGLKLLKNFITKMVETYENLKRRGRHNKKDINHYVDVIVNILRTGAQWSSIENDLHYQTYYKKFVKLAQLGIFSDAHHILLKFLEKTESFKNDMKNPLIIDSTMIRNALGSDVVGANHFDRHRKATKLTIIITNNGHILSMVIDSANINDNVLSEKAFDNIKIKVVGSRLIADKGYRSSKSKDNLAAKDCKFIYEPFKNQKEKLSEEDRKLMKNRIKVEHEFSWIFHDRRLRCRYERNSVNFLQFCYLAAIRISLGKLTEDEVKSLLD